MDRFPIVYVRGYAGPTTGIDAQVDDPFYGFNAGATHTRVSGDGVPTFYQFEGPLLRLMIDENYRDLYELAPEEAIAVKQVPGTLEAVLDALETDHEFLLEGGVFTEDLIETWLDYKRSKELDQIRQRPHPWEFMLYYDL